MAGIGGVCDCLRDLRETLGFLLCGLIEYACVFILPLIALITQRGMQQAALSRRERQIGVSLVWGIVVLLFICDYLREILWFLVCRLIEYACMLFSRRWRRSRRGMQQAALFRRQRQVGIVNVVLRFWVLSA